MGPDAAAETLLQLFFRAEVLFPRLTMERPMPSPDIRKGMPSTELSRETFEQRFKGRFSDPAYAPLAREIQAITDVAWDAYSDEPQGAAHPQGRARLRGP